MSKKLSQSSQNPMGEVKYVLSSNAVSNLEGMILTHLETLGLPKSQEEAIKSIIRPEIWNWAIRWNEDRTKLNEQK